tara:strand:- start:164 stop:424 length:261 start_codon:yes stop_codon:yes gene_type:complete
LNDLIEGHDREKRDGERQQIDKNCGEQRFRIGTGEAENGLPKPAARGVRSSDPKAMPNPGLLPTPLILRFDATVRGFAPFCDKSTG